MRNEFTHMYERMFLSNMIMTTYKLLSSGGNRIKTSKRGQVMYQYGGTIGPARTPKFRVQGDPTKEHMLVRPVVKSRPYQQGSIMMKKCHWLIQLVKKVEYLTIEYLKDQFSQLTVNPSETSCQLKESVYDHAMFSKNNIPSTLRICDTCFTQMILVGGFNKTEGSIPSHEDDDDYVTALISLGHTETLVGGDTFYFEVNSDGKKCVKQTVKYQHGNIQIGVYDEVKHGAFHWKNGYRGVINLSVQKKVLDHFYKHGNRYYVQYIEAGYPSGAFMAE